MCGYRLLEYHNRTLDRVIPVPVSATGVAVTGIGVVIASDDGFVRFFDSSLTKVFWERRVSSSVYASLVVDTERQRIMVAGTGGQILCFDVRGRQAWRQTLNDPVFATPTVVPGADLLFVATFHSRCAGLRLSTGEVLFELPLPQPWSVPWGGSAAHRDVYASPAATDRGTVVVSCAEHVLCLAADGTELWRHVLSATVKASPAIRHETGQVVVAAVDGGCHVFDVDTGSHRAEYRLGAKIIASPAISGSIAAVGTATGQVHALDLDTGQIRWVAPAGAPYSYTSMTVLPNGDFIATAASGNVYCLDSQTGTFRWETSQVLGLPNHEPELHITPIAEAGGNMYCASYSGYVYNFKFPVSREEPS